MSKTNQGKPPWQYPKDEKLIRNEINLSQSHQDKLDMLVGEHPKINTRVAMIRALIDGVEMSISNTIKQDPNLVREVARIGSNLNQFARYAHFKALNGEYIQSLEILTKMDEINASLEKLIEPKNGSPIVHQNNQQG